MTPRHHRHRRRRRCRLCRRCQILSCLRYTTRVRSPFNYYLLLRALFRSIAGGKFEASYKEILPVLPLVLTELSKLHGTALDEPTRALLIELCLTVPVRLASLLPHLPLMLRLMVHAVGAAHRGDLHGLALRTLEFWVSDSPI
jgi:transformation/transcription domain-associated protein